MKKELRDELNTRHAFSKAMAAYPPILNKDVSITPSSKLKIKVLVFDTDKTMQKWWRMCFKSSIKGAAAAVNSMSGTITSSEGVVRSVFDKNYIAVVVFNKKFLGMEVITHEASHVGFAYAKRIKNSPFAEYGDFDEELVAYPTGRAASAIVSLLYKHKIFE